MDRSLLMRRKLEGKPSGSDEHVSIREYVGIKKAVETVYHGIRLGAS